MYNDNQDWVCADCPNPVYVLTDLYLGVATPLPR